MKNQIRHSGGGRNPVNKNIPLRSKAKTQRHVEQNRWIPACAGMTMNEVTA
ncbi:MAG: hypothetical protein PHQ60_01305 [Sideroxydans sp.]|nr:hypothetical protein [Sideroxydans sp.]